MSRNLGGTSCIICNGTVHIDGAPHLITPDEAGRYWGEYRDILTVANAHCCNCDAKYLAWVSVASRSRLDCGHWRGDGQPFVDLSFRAAFNDEPAAADLPTREDLVRVAQRDHERRGAELLAELMDLQGRMAVHQAEGRSITSHWELYRR